ncbi:MAG: proprotein convertase P-domain-containing protein [Lysobacteraceae bacterium]
MRRTLLALASILSLSLTSGSTLAAPTDPDTSFSSDGELENPFQHVGVYFESMIFKAAAWDTSNRILIVGVDYLYDDQSKSVIGRLLANGLPDTSYGTQGTVPPLSRAGVIGWVVNDLLALPDGSALVCGTAKFSYEDRGFIARIDPTGHQDTTWARTALNGVPIVGDIDTSVASDCLTIEQLGDGRIVVGGQVILPDSSSPSGYSYNGLVDLFTANGASDESFGERGHVVFQSQSSSDQVMALSEQPGAGILASLGRWATGTRDIKTLRLRYDGTPDPDFADFSINRAKVPGTAMSWSLPNGRVRQAMPRYAPDTDQFGQLYLGQLFWLDGPANGDVPPYPYVTTLGQTLAENSIDFGNAALAPDGKVVYASRLNRSPRTCAATDTSLGLARLLNNGQPDPAFGTSGEFYWQPAVSFAAECMPGLEDQGVIAAHDVALSRTGKIFSLHAIRKEVPGSSGPDSYLQPLMSMRVGDAFGPEPWDTQPNPMVLAAASARPNSIRESDWVQVTGLDAGAYVPAFTLGGELRIGFGDWSTTRWVKNGDWLQVRGVAPASSGDSHDVIMMVGGIRGHNSWDSLGQRERIDFLITADQPDLPGARCSDGGLNSNCSAAIPDEGSVSSSINFVNGGSCNFVQGVRVGVDIEHSYIGDLRIKLTDPNGQVFIGGSEGIVTLLNRPKASAGSAEGSCSGDDIIASFDDAASIDAQTACGVPVSNPALSGDVAPAYRLSELVGRRTTGNDGANANGLWTLTIDDLVAGNSGQLHDWSLDIDCSASAPAISDLSVTVDGHTTHPWLSGTNTVVPGAGVNITWTVTNNGPMATSNGRFRASLPDGLTDAIEDAAWGCGTSAGGSCTPAIPCFGACLGNDIDAGLSLPVGGTATFFATGTLTELAGDGTLVIHGKTSVPQAIGGTRDDNPDNDNVQLQMPIQRITDIAVTAARHSWQGNVATIELDYSNAGPSNSLGFIAYIELPTGMNITGFSCRRGNLPCDDRHDLLTPIVVNITHGNGMLPNRTPYTAIITATWPGSNAPGSLYATLAPDATAIDTAPPSFEYAIGAPGTSSGDIFSNGFE